MQDSSRRIWLQRKSVDILFACLEPFTSPRVGKTCEGCEAYFKTTVIFVWRRRKEAVAADWSIYVGNKTQCFQHRRGDWCWWWNTVTEVTESYLRNKLGMPLKEENVTGKHISKQERKEVTEFNFNISFGVFNFLHWYFVRNCVWIDQHCVRWVIIAYLWT